MATKQELEKYLKYTFSSGSTTGKDYLCFQTKYINYIKSICSKHNWNIARIIRMHYEFSLYITDTKRYIYFSISDVRFCRNEWYDNILIRKVENEFDTRGGHNQYIALPDIESRFKRIFGGDDYV